MTHEDALSLKSFKAHCACGGYAWRINGRPAPDPHMKWCPQDQEYREWYAAFNSQPTPKHGGDTKHIETQGTP